MTDDHVHDPIVYARLARTGVVCPLCGAPGAPGVPWHDDVACSAKLDAWRPTGLTGLPGLPATREGT